MAIAGNLDLVARVITTNVERQLRDGFRNADSIGANAGKRMGTSMRRELEKATSNNSFGKLRQSLQNLTPEADRSARAFHALTRVGFVLQSGLGALAGSLGSVVGAIGALGGAALGATPAVAGLGGAFASLIVGLQVAKAAFRGIGAAISKMGQTGGGGGSAVDPQRAIDDAMRNLTRVIEDSEKRVVAANNRIRDAQLNLNDALAAGREEIQQLGFAAEDAALSEKKAGLELEKAREALLKTQDLPPNSRARREAELAFQEAELNYRKSKDTAKDLAKEQDRLAKTGVEGTQVVIDARKELASAQQDLSDTTVQALRDQEDAQRRLTEAINDSNNAMGGGGGADPFAKLSDSQRVFAEYIFNRVIPALHQLRDAAADSFLPVLQQQIERMLTGGLFDVLYNGITQISKGLAEATVNFVDAIMTQDNLNNIASFLEHTGKLLPQFGTIFGNVFASIVSILVAAEPVTNRFVSWIERGTTRLNEMLTTANNSGALTAFFQNAADLAARFGTIFSNVFGGIGDIISANVGPGTGGDMLITWLTEATDGFNNFDPRYLDNFFKGAAANFIAMSDVIGGFVSAIVNAGANPAIGEFWTILNNGAGTFRHLINESVKVAPFLADLLLTLGEIIGVFADSGSIQGFLIVLNGVANGVEAIARALAPLLNSWLGPLIGMLSAASLGFIIFGKAFAIINGTIRTALLPFQMLTGLITGQFAATQALAAAKAELTLAQLALNVAQTSANVIAKQEVVDGLIRTGQTQGLAVAKAELAVATQASTVATTQFGIASGVAGATAAAAFLPITIILAAIAAAAAVVFISMAANQAAMDKAVGTTTESMKKGANASAIYAQSMLAISDGPTKEYLSDTSNNFENLHKTMQKLSKSDGNLFGTWDDRTNNLAAAFEATGKSIANIAAKNLPDAQKAFANYTDGIGLNREEQLTALREMGDYTTALRDQAAQMGINLLNADGTINKEKELKFARGEGEVAIRGQIAALAEQITKTREAAMANVSASDAFKAATTDAEGVAKAFDLSQFITNMNDQIMAANTQIQNINTAQANGLSQASIDLLNTMGADAAGVAAALATADADTIAQFNNTSSALSAKTREEMFLGAEGFQSVLAGLADQMGPAGDEAAKKLLDGVAAGTVSAEQIVSALGIRIPGMIPGVDFEIDTKAADEAVSKVLGVGKDTGLQAVKSAAEKGTKVNVETAQAMSDVDSLQYKINHMNGNNLPINLNVTAKKNGGLINLYKNGGMISPLKFASGGMWGGTGSVTGPGSSRSDSVPAMLSAGEYVVNALSTKKYLPLLKAINNGSPTFTNNQGAQGGNTIINMTVNPSPGMDEQALASAVSRELAFQMRKGSV